MASKDDFTTAEWEDLRKGLVGAGMLVSLSDRDFTDTFGEASALAKSLAGQQVSGPTELMRELAKGRSPYGLTTSADRIRAEAMEAIRSSVATLAAKAPDEVDAYRAVVLDLATAVATAKGGETEAESAMIGQLREALGA
jgi:hypothetical protein